MTVSAKGGGRDVAEDSHGKTQQQRDASAGTRRSARRHEGAAVIGCSRCRTHLKIQKANARGNYAIEPTMAISPVGDFNITAAELILRLKPRKPVAVTARSLDARYRHDAWQTIRRHIPHVDPNAPGIFATLTHIGGRSRLYLIEGFHRAERHRRDRTDWSCYVLSAEETYAILTP